MTSGSAFDSTAQVPSTSPQPETPRPELRTHFQRRASDRSELSFALRESEMRYRRLFETARDGILIVDGETGMITDVNPFLIDFLGYMREEIVGNPFWEFGPLRDTAASKSKFRQLQEGEILKYDNLPLQSKAGTTKNVEFVSNLYLVEGRRVIQCNIRDITDRAHAEDRVRKEREELAKLVTALKERDAEMQAINHMNDLLQTCTVKEEAYEVVSLMAGDLFQLRPGAVAILHPEDQQLTTVSRWGGEESMEATFEIQDCWALRRGRAHVADTGGAGLRCKHFIKQPAEGTYCLPLIVQGEILGVLTLTGAAAKGDGTRLNSYQLAESMGEAIKLSLSNLRLRDKLREEATHDALTGLFNVRFLDEYLPRELHRAERSGSALCVAMFDLDDFKRVNDALGHHAGDSMLRALAKVLRQALRKSDTAVRYGGDEFLIVLPESTLAGALQRVEDIRALVALLPIPEVKDVVGPITLSGGVAAFGPDLPGARELIRAADRALYLAKEAGRNRIIVYAP